MLLMQSGTEIPAFLSYEHLVLSCFQVTFSKNISTNGHYYYNGVIARVTVCVKKNSQIFISCIKC